MKEAYFKRMGIVMAASAIGVVLAYFSASSAEIGNLTSGALFGALIGIYFAIGRQSGVG